MQFVALPGELTNYIRRELGDDSLELVWMPDEERIDKRFRFNSKDTGVGCYGICKWVRQRFDCHVDGVHHLRSEKIPYVTPLNGNHGLPLTLGRWIIEEFAASDLCRKGAVRHEEIDEWRERKLLKETQDRDRMAKEMARNDLMYNAFKRVADEMGVETPSTEEMISYEKDAERRSDEIDERDLEVRKVARFHQNMDQEDML